jgi:type VI secretion system secreted protein VgrG
MPAFMSIGTEEEDYYWVTPGEIVGDATGQYHSGWIKVLSFSFDVKDAERIEHWGVAKTREEQRQEKLKAQEEKTKDSDKVNTLKLSKSLDVSTAGILEWLKTKRHFDLQVDCCATESDYPFLSLIFNGVQPIGYEIDDDLAESLEFTWTKATILSWQFDEHGKSMPVYPAQFGVDTPKHVTTADTRGLSDYTPPEPNLHQGAGRSGAPAALTGALSGALPPVPEETRTYDQERRTLTIEPIGELEFSLDSFRAEEYVSKLPVYDLELTCDVLEIEPKDVVGQEVKFAIADEEGREDDPREPRHFSGIVASLLVGEMSSDRRRSYHAVVHPKVWLLTQRSNSRVFQEKTVKEIVEQVFSDAGFADFDMASVSRTYTALPYCVQYQETDFAFVSRLLEEHGIYYWFKHEEGAHTLILCDGPSGYGRCVEDPLIYDEDVHNQPRITSWRTHYAYVPGKFAARDFNFETPREPVQAQSQTSIDLTGITDSEIFEYPGHFADADQGTAVADRRLQEREVGYHFVHAVGCYDSIAPGMTIAVDGLPGSDADASTSDKRYFVTAVRHVAEQLPEYGMSIVGYRCILTCIPEETPFTPPRVTPKPVMHGPQTAIVVGDAETDDDVVDTDKYGRVKVQFHWDRTGQKDTNSSCWIRVAQSTAGAGYGAMVLPRLGMEVVVDFLDGDPDRPIIVGSVPNELHLPAHALPAAKYKSVFMTRSFPGGGADTFNELTFHDEKDKEEIYFHAERDFKRVVEHDDVLEVGSKEDGGQTVTIEGDQTITIKKGNRTLEVVEGEEAITVKGNRTVTISSGDHTIDVSSGKCAIKSASEITLEVGGSKLKISSSGIELVVGGSSLKVESAGVTVKGMNVKAEGSVQAEIKGLMVSISADAMLQTKGGITMMQ